MKKCEKCECYHDTGACPINKTRYSKWRHNFESSHYLYNYWFAYDTIVKTSSALLVESPGNVLKLEMAGIHNSLGMFGNTLKPEQKFLLEKAGVMDLYVLTDNDDAGRLGRKMIEKECSLYYNLHFIDLPDGVNDVGEMDVGKFKSFAKILDSKLWLIPILGMIIGRDEDLTPCKFIINVTLSLTLEFLCVSYLKVIFDGWDRELAEMSIVWFVYMICAFILYKQAEKIENARKSENLSN